jgi:tetratricopeptide (TPR) repeat protein
VTGAGGAGPPAPAVGPTATPTTGTGPTAAAAGQAALATVDAQAAPPVRAEAISRAWRAVEVTLLEAVPPPARQAATPPRGQDLVRVLRQRDVLSLEQGHALLDLLAVAERGQRPDGGLTDADVVAARDALARLQSAPIPEAARPLPPAATAATGPAPPREVPATGSPGPTRPAPRRASAYIVGSLLALVLAIGAIAFAVVTRRGGGVGGWPFGESPRVRGIAAFDAGRLEEARAALGEAIRADSLDAVSHLYLGRIARAGGDTTTARTELVAAVRLAPASGDALRELGAYFLAERNPDLARRFYARAVGVDPADRAAAGYLACALGQLGRTTEAARFRERAGPGPWTHCAPAPGATPAAAGDRQPQSAHALVAAGMRPS